MIYMSEESRQKHIKRIKECISAVRELPQSVLDSVVMSDTVNYLGELIEAIEREQLECDALKKTSGSGKVRYFGIKPLNVGGEKE